MEEPSTSNNVDDYSYNSITGNLIREVDFMLRRPCIESNLSKVLKDFFKQLNDSNKYLANGICNTRFVEAALLLQSSVALYGRKVDLLWECVIEYHKKIISYEKEDNKEVEENKLEERQQRFRRKKVVPVINRNEKNGLVNNFSFGNRNNVEHNYLNQTYEKNNLLNEWEKYREKLSHRSISPPKLCIQKHNVIFQPDTAIYNIDDEEYVGRYDQIQSTTLIDELIELDKSNLIIDSYDCLKNLRIESYVISDFLYENKINSDMNKDEYSKDLNDYIKSFRNGIKNHTLSSCKESFVNLERLPIALVRNKLKRMSCTDSLLDNSLSEIDDTYSVNTELNETNSTLRKSNASCSHDSAFFDCDDDMSDRQSIIFSTDNIITSTPSSRHFSDNEQESFDEIANEILTESTAITTTVDSSNISTTIVTTATTSGTTTTPTTSSSDTFITTAAANIDDNINNNKLCLGSLIVLNQTRVITRPAQTKERKEKKKINKVIKNRKLSIRRLKKLSTGITANWRQFERFYGSEYKPADGEGGYKINLTDWKTYESEDFIESDLDNEDIEMNNNDTTKTTCTTSIDNLYETIVDMPEFSSEVIETIKNSDAVVNEEEIQTSISTIEEVQALISTTEEVQASTSTTKENQAESVNNNNSNLLYENNLKESVSNWKSYVLPKLKQLNKSDFDIHEYESNILNSMDLGEMKFFNEIVNNESAADVVRHFIASLQLANTNNIEIIGRNPGKVANDTLQIKVIDKKKHHELLEDYKAPSTETFKKRLSRARQMDFSERQLESSNMPVRKKLKIVNCRWKQ